MGETILASPLPYVPGTWCMYDRDTFYDHVFSGGTPGVAPHIFTALLLWATCLFSQELEVMDLDAIADDLKFDNARLFISLGLPDRAVVELNEYLEIYIRGSHRNEALSSLAIIYRDRFDYQKAIRVYKRQFEEFSSSDAGIDAFFQIGICYFKMGYYTDAENIFRRIIREHPTSIFAGQARTQLELMSILNN